MNKKTLLVLATLCVAEGVAAQQSNSGSLHSDVSGQVMRAIGEKIASQNADSRAIIIGLSTKCDASVEGNICEGNSYDKASLNLPNVAAQELGAVLHLQVSANWEEDAKAFIAPPVLDANRSRRNAYQFCRAGPSNPVIPYVLTVRPSAIREVKAASEWHVVVIVNADPIRGECLGGATKGDYIVTRDENTGSFTVSDVKLLGSGTGHLR